MFNKLALKIGLLFFCLYHPHRVGVVFDLVCQLRRGTGGRSHVQSIGPGNTHSEVLEDSFESSTLNHVAMMELASDFIVIITDAEGNELTHSDTIEPEMRDVLQHTDFGQVPQKGEIVEDRWDEKRFIATDSPITVAGEHRGHVFMFAETNHIKGIVEHLRNQFLFVGLIAFGLTIAAIFILSRLITLPLIRMKEATEQLSEGNNEVSLHLDRNDELGSWRTPLTPYRRI
nr:HAMP domain-containing protein [Planococcus glaciei]